MDSRRALRWSLACAGLVLGAGLAIACSSFGEPAPGEAELADSSVPPGDGGLAPETSEAAGPTGPFCPEAGHTFCWDFTAVGPPSFGFEYDNQNGNAELGLDTREPKSRPASFFSRVKKAPGQSAARLGQALDAGPTKTVGLAFSIRQRCRAMSRTATLAELFCEAENASKGRGSLVRFESPSANSGRPTFQVNGVMRFADGGVSNEARLDFDLPNDAWTRVTVTAKLAPTNGALRLTVGSAPEVVAPLPSGLGCPPSVPIHLLVGAQFTSEENPDCEALYDDITLDVLD